MNNTTYEHIRPLITNQHLDGRTLKVTFTCPLTGTSIDSDHVVDAPKSTRDQLTHRTKRAFFNSIRGPLSSAIRSIFGQSTAGRLAGDVASQVAYVAATPTSTMAYSESQQQAAAIGAFQRVSGKFTWDGDNDRWIAA